MAIGRSLLTTALLLGLLTGCRSEPPRNLLLITLDTTRADYLGCYQGTGDQSPRLDQLAREGTLFRWCRSCSPTTLPSHASILTGLLPPSHAARRNGSDRLGPGPETLAETLQRAGFRTAAVTASFVLHRKFGLARGFDHYSDVAAGVAGTPLRAERRGDQIADEAIQLLPELASQPFFLWVHFYDPHYPYISREGNPQDSSRAYLEEISFMDRQVGRVLDELERLGLQRSTVVMVVGDHGEGLYEHGEITHGYFLYDTTLRVPLIIRSPGVPAGRAVETAVDTIDLAPTALELLQRPGLAGATGTSLVPLLLGRESRDHSVGYAESIEAHVQFDLSILRSLSAGGWKYVHAPRPELYHLTQDPEEDRNVWEDEPERGARLRDRLELLMQGLPTPAPESGGPELSPEEAERIEALGYFAGEGSPVEPGSLDRFEPSGGNPLDHARHFRLTTARRQAREGGDLVTALQISRELQTSFPGSTMQKLGHARVLEKQGRFQEAVGLCQEILKTDPAERSTRLVMGTMLIRLGRFEEAMEEFETLRRDWPEMTAVRYELGLLLSGAGRLGEAAEEFQAGLAVEPRNARLLHAMGTVRAMQERFPEAVEYFQRALESDPGCQRCRADLDRAMGSQ